MIHLGIDFGTSNTVVSYELEGKYNIMMFEHQPFIPSLIAKYKGNFYYGFEAAELLSEKEAIIIDSIKQHLHNYYAGKKIIVGEQEFVVYDLVLGFFQYLKQQIKKYLPGEDEDWFIIATVPANSSSQQRYVTMDAMMAAGLNICGLLNEPTASGFEFSHYFLKRNNQKKGTYYVLVYDFGGGTFDVSLLKIEKLQYSVLGTLGHNNLGGNNFDKKLFTLVCRKGNIDRRQLSYKQKIEGLMESKSIKESISISRGFLRRNLVFDLENIGIKEKVVKLESAEYYESIKVEINMTIELIQKLFQQENIKSQNIDIDSIDYVYLVGGSSKLPYVQHSISKIFPKTRIKIPDNTSAIGACIYSAGRNFQLFECFTRNFGVIRLKNNREVFDPIFPKGTELSNQTKELNVIVKDYDPQFTIGHLKFLECSEIDNEKTPMGTVNLIQEIRFPYDPEVTNPEREKITRKDLSYIRIREEYRCDNHGIISAKITRLNDGFTMGYNIVKEE